MAKNRSAHARDPQPGTTQDSEAQQKAQAAAGEAKGQAQAVGRDAKEAAQDLAQTAQHEAGQLKDEAVGQARSLAGTFQDQARDQAQIQQGRLAGQSRTVTDDLHRVLSGQQPQSDMVRQAVSAVADRAETLTQRLETAQPMDLVDDVRRFASRRPATFLGLALGVGLLAGRLTRGVHDADQDGTRDARQFSTARYTQDGRPLTGAAYGRSVQPEAVHADVAPHHIDSQVPAYTADGAPRVATGTTPGATTTGTSAVAGGLPYGTEAVPAVDPVTGQPAETPFDQNRAGGRA